MYFIGKVVNWHQICLLQASQFQFDNSFFG